MQIIGAPFDDMTVLRAGEIYETGRPWRQKRPALAQLTDIPPLTLADKAAPQLIEPELRDHIDMCASMAGLSLTDAQRQYLHASTPNLWRMMDRIAFDDDWSVEGATTFSLDRIAVISAVVR